MSEKIHKKLEIVAYVAVIIMSLVTAIIIAKPYFFQNIRQPEIRSISKGTPISLDENWKANKKTLILVVSTQCHFCSESADFYKRLIINKLETQFVFISPQSAEDTKSYLTGLGIPFENVKQTNIKNLNISGTPTLILVDENGNALNSWIGKLSPEKEEEVIKALQTKS
jgi:thioredoxin-related protein